MSHDNDLSVASSSKNPIVMKIMVDWQHYEKLLEAEKFQDKYHKKITKDLEHKTSVHDLVTPSTRQKKSQSKFSDENETLSKFLPTTEGNSAAQTNVNQTGEGNSSNQNDYKSQLRHLVKEELSDLWKQELSSFLKENIEKFNQQSGKGASDSSDLPPAKAETFLTSDNEPKTTTTVNEKSIDQLLSQNDINSLMSKIPNNFKEKGKSLLKYFLDNPLLVSWDSNGVLSVNNISIPNSNFYSIFPELYAQKPKRSLPGFVTLSTFLLTSGLQHLLRGNKINHFSRKRPLNAENVNEEDIDYRDFSKNSHWYFIGNK